MIESLEAVGLTKRGRVVVEKPFGRDLASARELNGILHKSFPEERIFRIDHYLGKESVEDLMVFRFSNALLEPVWKRNYVRSVQVTFAESIGVEGRGSFYDSVGALRDVVQNHLLQVVALLAMEPPVGPEANFLQDEKAKVFAATESICCSDVVRGQYVGYLDEPGVAPGSTTETFVAARLEIDSWRWAGVPFYIRAGKALARAATEAVVEFEQPPRLLFDEAGGPAPHRNLVRFRLGENDGVTFTLQAKTPGEHMDSEDVNLTVDFAAALGERQDALRAAAGGRAGRQPSPLRPPGRRRADVADRPAGPRRPRSRLPLRAGVVGAAGGGRARARGLVPAELSGRRAARRPGAGPGHRARPTTTAATPTPRARLTLRRSSHAGASVTSTLWDRTPRRGRPRPAGGPPAASNAPCTGGRRRSTRPARPRTTAIAPRAIAVALRAARRDRGQAHPDEHDEEAGHRQAGAGDP